MLPPRSEGPGDRADRYNAAPMLMTTPRPLRLLALAGLLATLPLVGVACGGGETGSANPVPADPNLTVIALDIKFDQKAYTAPAGEVRIEYDSQGQQVHSMILQDAAGTRVPDFRLLVPPNKSVGGVVSLPAGSYTMICDIPGHEAAGMIAQLTVG